MDSALVAAIISSIISFLVCKWQISKQNISSEEARLNNQLFNILKIQIKYPYLENRQFSNNWDGAKTKDDRKYQQYDSYCCILFNFMWQIYELYDTDVAKTERFFSVSEEVSIHKKWWQHPLNPRDNIDGYSENYRIYINSVIEKGTK